MIPLHFRPAKPGEVTLETGVIHLWRQSLDIDAEPLLHILSDAERQRVESIRNPRRRQRVAASRLLLRHILAPYLEMKPEALQLSQNASGRPDLDPEHHGRPFVFNASHSGDLLVIAVVIASGIGVDVEAVHPRSGMARVLERCFTDSERSAIEQAGPQHRLEMFYRGWTRKEALLKALGQGVFQGADGTEVSLADAVSPGVRRLCGDREAAREWKLLNIQPSGSTVGAIAVPRDQWRLCLMADAELLAH